MSALSTTLRRFDSDWTKMEAVPNPDRADAMSRANGKAPRLKPRAAPRQGRAATRHLQAYSRPRTQGSFRVSPDRCPFGRHVITARTWRRPARGPSCAVIAPPRAFAPQATAPEPVSVTQRRPAFRVLAACQPGPARPGTPVARNALQDKAAAGGHSPAAQPGGRRGHVRAARPALRGD